MTALRFALTRATAATAARLTGMGIAVAATASEQPFDYILAAATIVGGFAALLAVAAATRTRYRRTLGRRRDRYQRLGRLGVGAQLSFFASVLGEPPAIRRTITAKANKIVTTEDPNFDPKLAAPDRSSYDAVVEQGYTECIFVDRDYYLQTISDDDETVLAFSITTRRKRFAPTFEAPIRVSLRDRILSRRDVGMPYKPLLKVRLGRTRFSDLDPVNPDDFAGPHFVASPGARVQRYSEFHYFGNPGNYLTYVVTASTAGHGPATWEHLIGVVAQAGYHEWPYPSRPNPNDWQSPPDHAPPPWDSLTAARTFRQTSAISTLTVIHQWLWAENFPANFGLHGDDVRLLP